MVVLPSPAVELSAEVAEGAEVNPSHEFLREDPVEPLELPTTPRVVRPPVDHLDALLLAEALELSRDVAAPIVDVERLGLAPALERPPKIVRGFSGPFPPITSSHHEEAGAIVQDRVNVDLPATGDAELVDVHLPERVDVMPLESLEGLGLADNADHEPMSFQDPVYGHPAQLGPSPRQHGVDPHRSPRRVSPAQLEDSVGEVSVDTSRTPMRAPRVVSEPLDAFLSVVSTPTSQRAFGDSEDLAEVR